MAFAGGRPQSPATHEPTIRVFLDCGRACDFDFIRRQIPYLDYVRDRKDADVHVLVTTQPTSTGGREYDIQYIGLGRFDGETRSSDFISSGSDTSDERRHDFARTFALGLVPYLLSTDAAADLAVQFSAPTAAPRNAAPANDPWNLWVFRISASTDLQSERSTSSRQVHGNLSANRTTNLWKIGVSSTADSRRDTFTLSDNSILKSSSHRTSSRLLVVRSLGVDHWGAAVRVSGGANTRNNERAVARVAAGLEYDVFPYAESSERSLTLDYTVGMNYYKYIDRTIFGRLHETAPDQQFVASLNLRQPWGATSVGFETANYLNDFSRHHFNVNGRINVRLVRGLDLNVDGSASQVHDQLYLAAGEASNEEILLRVKNLQTSYRYGFSVGVSFQFGSIFNNVVNPRFDGR